MNAARSSTATATTGTASAPATCGRFAPTPSGPLHLGSLLAATASYLSARHAGGRWLLRIDDLDRDRCVPGLSDEFQATLTRFGFEWDGNVLFQSGRAGTYRDALAAIAALGQSYACRCSRSELSAAQVTEPGSEPVYPGTCRNDPSAATGPHALRFAIDPAQPAVEFEDAFQGHCRQDCLREAGDFVIRRRDGQAAYHLATVVDDAEQGVNEVVRGADLLSSTPRQMLLQRALGLPDAALWARAAAHRAGWPEAGEVAARRAARGECRLPAVVAGPGLARTGAAAGTRGGTGQVDLGLGDPELAARTPEGPP